MKKTPQKLEEKVTGLLRNTDYSLSEISRGVGLSKDTIKKVQDKMIKQEILDDRYRRLVNGIVKYQRDKAIKLLEKTDYSLSKIGKEVGLSFISIKHIQNKAIEQDMLDKKYRRIKGIIKYKGDKVMKLLEKTNYSLEKISKKVGLSGGTIQSIQDMVIKQKLLNERYRRLQGGNKGIIKYQKDEVIKLLETTDYNLTEIGDETGFHWTSIKRVQDKTIKQGLLDKKYRRIHGGTVKYQKDEVIEMLKKTDYNLKEIGKETKLSSATVRNIQIDAIKEGLLDEKYRRSRSQNNLNLEAVLRDYRGKEIEYAI